MSNTTTSQSINNSTNKPKLDKNKKPKPRKVPVTGAVVGDGKIYLEPTHETQLSAGTFDIDVTGYQMMDGKGYIIEMFKVLQKDYIAQMETVKSQEQKVRMVVDFLNELACNYDASAYAYVLGALTTTFEGELFTQAYMVGKVAPLIHKAIVPILNALMPLAGLPVLNVYHVLQQIKEAQNAVKVLIDDIVGSFGKLDSKGAARVLALVYDTSPRNEFFTSIGDMMKKEELVISRDSSFTAVVASLGYNFEDSLFEYTIKPHTFTQMWYFQSQYVRYNIKVRHASFALVKHKTTFLTAGSTSSQHLEILARVNSIVDYRLRSFQHYIDIPDYTDMRSTFKRSLAVDHTPGENIPAYDSKSFRPAPPPMTKIVQQAYPNQVVQTGLMGAFPNNNANPNIITHSVPQENFNHIQEHQSITHQLGMKSVHQSVQPEQPPQMEEDNPLHKDQTMRTSGSQIPVSIHQSQKSVSSRKSKEPMVSTGGIDDSKKIVPPKSLNDKEMNPSPTSSFEKKARKGKK